MNVSKSLIRRGVSFAKPSVRLAALLIRLVAATVLTLTWLFFTWASLMAAKVEWANGVYIEAAVGFLLSVVVFVSLGKVAAIASPMIEVDHER